MSLPLLTNISELPSILARETVKRNRERKKEMNECINECVCVYQVKENVNEN